MQKIYIGIVLFSTMLLSTWIIHYSTAYQITKGSEINSWLNKFRTSSFLSPGHSKQLQHGMTGIDDEYSARLNRVNEFCKMKQRNNKTCQNGEEECKLEGLVIDENNKVIFCSIPKVASTIWKFNLAMMSGKDRNDTFHVHWASDRAKYNLFPIRKYSKAERAYRIQKYFKFVFVRHPLTRLVSAYRNKIETGTNWYGQLLLPLIMKHVRRKTDKTPISFQEFASYILSGKGPMANNLHWAPYNSICRFCEVRYDFIGRQEFLDKDSNYLVQVQFDKPLYANFSNAMHRTHSDIEMTRKYFTQLTEETKLGLLRLYSEDMEMFGYKSSDIF